MARTLLIAAATMTALLSVARAEWFGLAVLQGVNSTVSGTLYLYQTDCSAPVEINGTVYGLTPGKHGFHIHQYGDLGDGCKNCGSHYNPEQTDHGSPDAVPHHAGDLANVIADTSGVATVRRTTAELTLCYASRSVLGRSVVLHASVDDLGAGAQGSDTKKTGNSGARIACGVIALAAEPPALCPHVK